MTYYSHKLKVEEKKVFKKVVLTSVTLVLILFLLVFGGLNILAKIILIFSSLRNDQTVTSNTTTGVIFPPHLNPNYDATFSAKISVSGFSEKDMTVKILVNGKEQAKTTTDDSGEFTASNIILKEGSNTITATNLKENQESTSSSPIYVIYKKDPPKLEVEYPKDGDKFGSDNQTISISGQTDSGSRININDRMAIVNTNGKFDFRIKLNDGENTFKIIAQDHAGNRSEKELKITFKPD